MSSTEVKIGQLSRRSGCKVPTIRYYEQIGLMPEPRRSTGNTRLYGPEHIQRLTFINHCRQLGFSQVAIRELLDFTDHPERSCDAVAEIASAHLDEVNRRIDRLTALKAELERMITACGGGRVDQCSIIETLAAHSHS
jgi:DNA-binding transcriptional MerR regulator